MQRVNATQVEHKSDIDLAVDLSFSELALKQMRCISVEGSTSTVTSAFLSLSQKFACVYSPLQAMCSTLRCKGIALVTIESQLILHTNRDLLGSEKLIKIVYHLQ